MYFRDNNGNLWIEEKDGFRNIGVEVKEKEVTFKRKEKEVTFKEIKAVRIIKGSVKAPSVDNLTPVTIREAIKRFGVTESSPLNVLSDEESAKLYGDHHGRDQ